MTKKEKIESLTKSDIEYFDENFNSFLEIMEYLFDSPYSTKELNQLILSKFQHYQIPYKKFTMKTKGPIWNYAKYELIQLINRCKSPTEMLIVMNTDPIGSNFATLKRRFEVEGLDYNIFKQKKSKKELGLEDLKENNPLSSDSIRELVLDNNLKKHECEFCGMQPFHMGQPFNMIVYHKDGNPKNNLLNNIGFICPVCQIMNGVKQ